MRNCMRTMVTAGVATAVIAVGAAGAHAATVRVDHDGAANWALNPDPTTATPYEFSIEQKATGAGSLHVLPIANTQGSPGRLDKFIAAQPLGDLVGDVSSVSFDFLIDPAGVNAATTYKQFYMNVYANLPGSTTFYDCRFDYVAGSGSSASFTTLTVEPGDTATSVGDRAGDGYVCPATLGGMAPGSTVSRFTLNVGDTSLNDTGVGGYLDNVVVETSSDSTTYDFEATPAVKDDCKKDGWAAYGFTNQGLCVSRSVALARQ
jgi:hypothetical protein